MKNKIKLVFIIVLMSVLTSCSEGLSALDLERIILACNAGKETDREKCKQAEKAQAVNIKKLMNNFIK